MSEHNTEKEPLRLRTTSTGVEVIEGDCPHCGHPAMDHWSDGCQGGKRGGHCLMGQWKLRRLTTPSKEGAMSDSAENAAPDCRCPVPKPDGRGKCLTCGRFACEYADRGKTRCDTCDCFIDLYPDSPRDLHPEAFIVGRITPSGGEQA